MAVQKWKKTILLILVIWTCVWTYCAIWRLISTNESDERERRIKYAACGFLDVPAVLPIYSSLDKHVVLRSIYWDSRRFENLDGGFWVLLAVVEKNIVSNNLITGVQIDNATLKSFEVRETGWNAYIDEVCPKLTHKFVVVRCKAQSSAVPRHAALLYTLHNTSDNMVLSAASENAAIPPPPPNAKKRYTVVSCLAPGHGKSKLLRHWIRYEKTIGVDHIHVIADQSFVESGSLNDSVVREALDSGFLSIVIWPRWFTGWQVFYREQVLAYQDCIHRFQGIYDYVFPHDADDFFVPLIPGAKLNYYIDKYCPDGTCAFSWEQNDPLDSGLTGKIGIDGNVTDKIVAKNSRIKRDACKCIHRLEDVYDIGIHEGIVWSKECRNTSYVPNTAAYVAHVRY